MPNAVNQQNSADQGQSPQASQSVPNAGQSAAGGVPGTNPADSGQQNNNAGPVGNFDAIFSSQSEQQQSDAAAPPPQSSGAVPPAGATPPMDATQIMDNLVNGMQFGQGMNQDQFAQFANGDLESFNSLLQSHGQNTVKQILPVVAQLLQSTQTSLRGEFETQLESRVAEMLKARQVETELSTVFGFQDNPTMQTLAENIYKGALPQVKGDHKQAVEMTKSMMATMGQHINKSLNLTTPPESQNRTESADDFAKLFKDL